MKKTLFIGVMAMLAVIPATSLAQGPDGSDVNQAIPIYFGQTIADTIDSKTKSVQVYSVTVGKGQALTVTAKAIAGQGLNWTLLLAPSSYKSVGTLRYCSDYLAQGGCQTSSTTLSLTYQVATAGTYYIQLEANSPGISYQLQVTTTGTPIATPNPTQAGCLNGQVDYITYSLQLIAASLPDESSIGGTKLCATCTVKPPAYPILVQKLETAMGLNVGVSACYDAAGNIFQLKMIHP